MPPCEEDISETPRPASAGEGANWNCVIESTGRLAFLPIDDYIFSFYVSRECIVIGTVYGRLLLYTFPSRTQLTNGSFSLLQAHCEDAIRSVYAHGGRSYCVIGNQACLEFDNTGRDTLIKFDRRISAQIKYVLQDGRRIIIPSLGVTIAYDFIAKQTLLSPLRLPDSDVVPLDFRNDCLITFIHPGETSPPSLKVLRLPLSPEEPRWGTVVECIFHQELPKSVHGLTKAKFWGLEKIAFITNGTHLYVFDIASGNRLAHWKTGNLEVVILDASNPNRLITIDSQARLRVWKLGTPLHHITEHRLQSKFDLNQVYQSVQKDDILFYSADGELAFVAVIGGGGGGVG